MEELDEQLNAFISDKLKQQESIQFARLLFFYGAKLMLSKISNICDTNEDQAEDEIDDLDYKITTFLLSATQGHQ